MSKLEIIHLNDSHIRELKGLENCLNLVELSCSYTKNLQEITLFEEMHKLSGIYLSDASIKIIFVVGDKTRIEQIIREQNPEWKGEVRSIAKAS
jgi:Leucine-rich repeat (LRR) protein